MSDISDCIIKILADNGVSVEQKELWGFAGKAENVIQLDFSEHDKRLIDEIMQLKERIAELESRETETCEKEPISDDCRPSMEWYDNRHQSDCIEINRLNTTIDVLIHKVEYLRQFARLE